MSYKNKSNKIELRNLHKFKKLLSIFILKKNETQILTQLKICLIAIFHALRNENPFYCCEFLIFADL